LTTEQSFAPSHAAIDAPPVSHRVEPSDPTPVHAVDHPRAADSARLSVRRRWFDASGVLFNVIIPIVILAVGAGIVVALGTTKPKGREQDDQTAVGRLRRLPAADVMQVLSPEDIGKPLELHVDGVVVPFREVQIAAEVSGRIIEKSDLFRAGNYVTTGQLLCRIDPTDYEQEVLRLTRAREQDYEALKEVDQEVANTKLMLDIAKQDTELAQREVARMRSLPRGFVSETELDQAQKGLLGSQQNRVTLENQMNLLAARRGRLEASERLATTQLETAKINLERCEVRSPGNGVIIREDAQLNSFIQRGSPIVTLEDVSKAEVAVHLRMDQLYWVLDQQHVTASPEDAASLTIAAAQGRPGYSIPPTPAVIEYEVAGMGGKTYSWDGMLVRYAGIGLDSRSRTVPVRIEVDAPDRFAQEQGAASGAASPTALVRGMYVKVRLLIKPKTPLVAIPSLAIRPGNRVWHFKPDPSVLDDPLPDQLAVDTVEGAEGQAGDTGAVVTDSAPASKDNFDPTQWVPGRVTARGDLTAVDSLWIGDGIGENEARSNSAQPDQRRYWICDVRGGELTGGDWVVVSPLGDFGRDLGDAPLSVRVPAAEVQP
jgi:multidrug efflux pump subunit AcrA (membrane-fusion protein)